MIIECENCRQYVDAKKAGSYWRHFAGREPSRRYTLLCCAQCQEPILVGQTNIGNMAEGDQWDTPFAIFPQGDIRINPTAPVEIRSALSRGLYVLSIACVTASSIMCRKTLEGDCAARGVEERNLSTSLRKMKELTLIGDQLFEWSDALRMVGNEAAHGVKEDISQQDAKDAIEFTNAIIDGNPPLLQGSQK